MEQRVVTMLKKLIKRTFLYDRLRAARLRRALRKWDDTDQQRLEFYRQFIPPGGLCFDVGANVGNRTKVFLRLGARVVAVEPQESCIRIIEGVLAKERNLTLVPKALGEAVGEADMLVSSSDTLSSLSTEWIDAVQESGRFPQAHWTRKTRVEITTLDQLIVTHGRPVFIKIDVEGYEYPVIRGLSSPVAALSLEFTPEYEESLFKCMEHLASLGMAEFNYSPGESMRWALDDWLDLSEMKTFLFRSVEKTHAFGDVYARSRDIAAD